MARQIDNKIDYKAPSIKKMIAFVDTLSDEEKDAFADASIKVKEDGTEDIDKMSARDWLWKNHKDEVEWKNVPANPTRKSIDILRGWRKK